jgi:MoaA/NifB/PqqE/SkfB family radical SAM enzyme
MEDLMAVGTKKDMTLVDYTRYVDRAVELGAKQINLLGGEPLLHSKLDSMCLYNAERELKTTVYTNGAYLHHFPRQYFHGAKLRVSVYRWDGPKGALTLLQNSTSTMPKFDMNFMVGADTTLEKDMLLAADTAEDLGCEVFFISSIRDLYGHGDFFEDSSHTMPVLEYKKLVHDFLHRYAGDMDIHISKRGVFESTCSVPHNKCKFANQFIGGGIVQCPYDIVNQKWQEEYEFDSRPCQQNNTCLMSKIVLRRRT